MEAMEAPQFYDLDYKILKGYLYSTQDVTLLKDAQIKRKLIDSIENKYDFVWFVQDASLELLKALLDEEGIAILKDTSDIDGKLNALLTSSKAKDFLLQSASFCEIVIEHFSYMESYIYALEEGAIPFIHYIIDHHPDFLETAFLKLKASAQKMVLENTNFPLDTTKKFLVRGTRVAAEYILENDLRFSSLADFSFYEIFSIASKKTKFPPYFLRRKDFLSKISSMGNVKDYRFLIRNLSSENDVAEIEEARKKFYDEEIFSFLEKENMLKRYYECYQEMCECLDRGDYLGEIAEEIMVKYFHADKQSNDYEFQKQLFSYYSCQDKEGLRRFLEQESHLQLSNMIIDYHFEEVPYNFFIDLKQLIHFQEGEGRTLSDEEIEIYSKLLTLDDLSYQDARNLHLHLSSSMVETYYDHFRTAKDKAASLIEEQMLTVTSVQKYKDNKLSARVGVDIYVVEGDEYSAFVKSLNVPKGSVLNQNDILYGTDGGSYSLDGSAKLNTFRDPRTYYNVIFSSFPQNQVVHMYPVDSFSNYIRGTNPIATTRVYELHTPTELITKSSSYNEIILSLPNSHKKDELNSALQTPTLLGIYCYDTITDNDVLSAKNLGTGIVLIKTKSYGNRYDGERLNMFDTMSLGTYGQNQYDYLADISVNDMVGRRKF